MSVSLELREKDGEYVIVITVPLADFTALIPPSTRVADKVVEDFDDVVLKLLADAKNPREGLAPITLLRMADDAGQVFYPGQSWDKRLSRFTSRLNWQAKHGTRIARLSRGHYGRRFAPLVWPEMESTEPAFDLPPRRASGAGAKPVPGSAGYKHSAAIFEAAKHLTVIHAAGAGMIDTTKWKRP
jgi:hypothetical protein